MKKATQSTQTKKATHFSESSYTPKADVIELPSSNFKNSLGEGRVEDGKKVFYTKKGNTKCTIGLVKSRISSYEKRRQAALSVGNASSLANNSKKLHAWRKVKEWMEE